jgi:hypothetical protein
MSLHGLLVLLNFVRSNERGYKYTTAHFIWFGVFGGVLFVCFFDL